MSAHAPGARDRLGSFDAHLISRAYVIESLPSRKQRENRIISLGIDNQYPGISLINIELV